MINAPGKGGNANVDYALSDALRIMSPGERGGECPVEVTAKAYLKALEMVVSSIRNKSVYYPPTSDVGENECIDVLASYLNDESGERSRRSCAGF